MKSFRHEWAVRDRGHIVAGSLALIVENSKRYLGCLRPENADVGFSAKGFRGNASNPGSALPGYLAIDPAASATNPAPTAASAAAIDPATASNRPPAIYPSACSGLWGRGNPNTPPTAARIDAPDHFPMLRRNKRRSSNSLSAVVVLSMDSLLYS